MKKSIISAVLIGSMLLAGCTVNINTNVTESSEEETSEDTSASVSSETEKETETEATTTTTAPQHATVNVTWRDDAPAIEYDFYATEDGEAETQVMFTTDIPVTNLTLMGLTDPEIADDGSMSFGTVEYFNMRDLNPGRGRLVNVAPIEDIPQEGYSYTDIDGRIRFFAICMSGEDGSIYSQEFTPKD
ncbi:MAG: hypothetical protein IKE53_08895 [Clostridiales bacterium]|nr:hypothetical protein [Clostridiales bacterium]